MKKILFVCLGNICRGPMAEFIMKDEVRRQNREGEFWIASAGTSGEEEGNPVYPPARAELAKHGISCEGKRAKKFLPSDYSAYDYILCMENLKNTVFLRILESQILPKNNMSNYEKILTKDCL